MTMTGHYINIVLDSFDIFIIFPEWWDDLEVEEVSDIETRVEECAKANHSFSSAYVDASGVRDVLNDEFKDEEYQILVFDAYSGRGVQ